MAQTYTSQNTGSVYYHTQNRGGIGADITLKAPVTDASTVFSFDMKGLIRVNSTGNWLEFHNGVGWTKALDINTVFTKATVGLPNVDNTSDAMKPLSNATINALLGKFNLPTGTASEYLDGAGNPKTFPTIPVPVAQYGTTYTKEFNGSVTTSTGTAVFNISAAGFTSISNIQVSVRLAGATVLTMPLDSITDETLSSITVSLVESKTTNTLLISSAEGLESHAVANTVVYITLKGN